MQTEANAKKNVQDIKHCAFKLRRWRSDLCELAATLGLPSRRILTLMERYQDAKSCGLGVAAAAYYEDARKIRNDAFSKTNIPARLREIADGMETYSEALHDHELRVKFAEEGEK